jgi:Transposase DDE domain group 1
MSDTTILPFSFPAVGRKKITAAFDGGRLTSDGGVMLLALADRCVGVAEKLSCAFPEWRDRSRIVHSLADMIRARIFAIACGYEDGNDLDARILRSSSPAAGCRTQIGICVRSRPCLAWRMHCICAR